jgi:uncharacterized protein (TIGR03905 family)
MHRADIRYGEPDAEGFIAAEEIMPFLKPLWGMTDLFPVVTQKGLSGPSTFDKAAVGIQKIVGVNNFMLHGIFSLYSQRGIQEYHRTKNGNCQLLCFLRAGRWNVFFFMVQYRIMYEYKTSGTCSKKIHFDLEDGKVRRVSFEDGCDGNLKAISKLVDGMEAKELVKKLKGNRCEKRGTSCADQLALAVEERIAETAGKPSGGRPARQSLR